MSDLLTAQGLVAGLGGLAALVFLAALLRVAAVLSREPANEMLPDVLYLRAGELRKPLLLGVLLLVVASVGAAYPLLAHVWPERFAPHLGPFYAYLAFAEAVLLLGIAVALVRLAAPYSRRGGEARVRGVLGRLAAELARPKQ